MRKGSGFGFLEERECTFWLIGRNWQRVTTLERGEIRQSPEAWESDREGRAGIDWVAAHQGPGKKGNVCEWKKMSESFFSSSVGVGLYEWLSAAWLFISGLACCLLVYQLDWPQIEHQGKPQSLSESQQIPSDFNVRRRSAEQTGVFLKLYINTQGPLR